MSHGCSPTTRRRWCSQQSGTRRCLPDQRNHASSNPRKKWCSLYFLISTVWCTMSSHRLDRLLMVISTCTFCRGCVMQFGANGATSGRESGFCTMIMHQATHRLLCINSLLREAFLSSLNHRTLQISPRVTFGSSLLWKQTSRGCVSQPWRTSNRMWRPNSGRFQKKPSTSASNNGRIDGASVCERKGPIMKVIRWALSYVIPLQCYTTFPGTFWLPLVCYDKKKINGRTAGLDVYSCTVLVSLCEQRLAKYLSIHISLWLWLIQAVCNSTFLSQGGLSFVFLMTLMKRDIINKNNS